VKIWNSELQDGELGQMLISPDSKWAVFRLAGVVDRIYIFNRESMESEKFK